MAGGRWPDLARALAIKAAAETAIEDTAAIALLRDLDRYFRYIETNGFTDRVSSEELCFYLHTLAERPWRRYHRGGPITPYQLAQLCVRSAFAPPQFGSRRVWRRATIFAISTKPSHGT